MDQIPYQFSLERKNKKLTYLGVRHSWDPSHPQFHAIEAAWSQWIANSKTPLAVLENRNQGNWPSHEQAILKFGEVGLALQLAYESSVEVACFEPDRGTEMNLVAQNFPKEEVVYYYFARSIAQWNRLKEKPSVEEYMRPFLENMREVTQWENINFAITGMKELHQKLFSESVAWDDYAWWHKLEDPTNENNPLQEVVRAVGSVREESITAGMEKAWNEHDLFIVYGRGHAEHHEAFLRNLLRQTA